MKLLKKLSVLAAIAGMAFPLAALAGNDLTIVNNTNQDSTTVINGGLCSSTVLGSGGVTKAHSTNVVTAFKLALACISNKDNCSADIYMTNNCTGPKVGNVIFSTTTGIKSFNVYDATYVMAGAGFQAKIDGGL